MCHLHTFYTGPNRNNLKDVDNIWSSISILCITSIYSTCSKVDRYCMTQRNTNSVTSSDADFEEMFFILKMIPSKASMYKTSYILTRAKILSKYPFKRHM